MPPSSLKKSNIDFYKHSLRTVSDATEEFYYSILSLHPPPPPSSVDLKTDGAKNLWENALFLGVDSSTFTEELWGPQGSFIYVTINYSKDC